MDKCNGKYSDPAGWGPGYQYSCIHSGLIPSSGDISTVWYNYALASAGTIIDENTTEQNPVTNTTTATESICPKGWTLPKKTQIDSNRDMNNFNPVLGGRYHNGTLENTDKYGRWWGSEMTSSAPARQSLGYTINSSGTPILATTSATRYRGDYIRCVAKQKTITDLAYMQDVTFFLDFSGW